MDPGVECSESGKMDALSQTKLQKLDQDISRQPTRLCDLPNALLHTILSLLPTKDVVKMSMASKRWESVWRSIPRLELHEKDRPTQGERRVFMDFVDRCLRLRDGSPIKVFSLSVSSSVKSDRSRISAWIADVALLHNVQDLHLSIDHSQPLPPCIFLSEQLRKLHLKGPASLGVLNQVYLPNLKDLTLEAYALSDEESTQKLLSSRSLEKLSMIGCKCSGVKALTIISPMLHTALIQCDVGGAEVAIDAPNLKHLRFHHKLRSKVVISGSPLLDEAEIFSWRYTSEMFVCENFLNLLQDISCVKNLTLSFNLLKGLKGLEYTVNTIPVFPNLRKLKLVLIMRDDLDWNPLCLLLRKCPYLETLEFDGRELSTNPPVRCQDPSASFFESDVRKITVGCFRGSKEELSALEVFLKGAPMLEEMVLKHYDKCSPKQLKTLNERYLSMLPEVSRTCRIRIVSSLSE